MFIKIRKGNFVLENNGSYDIHLIAIHLRRFLGYSFAHSRKAYLMVWENFERFAAAVRIISIYLMNQLLFAYFRLPLDYCWYKTC